MLVARALLAVAATSLLGCGGTTLRAEPVDRAPSLPPLWIVERLAGTSVLVIDPTISVSEDRPLSDFDDWEGEDRLRPAPPVALPAEVTILGPDGPCRARVGRPSFVDTQGLPHAPEHDEPAARDETEDADAEAEAEPDVVDVHTSLVALLEPSCDGYFAVPLDAEARFLAAPEFDYETLPAEGTHSVELGEGLVVIDSRGPPIDDICPDSPTYTLTTSGQTLVALEGDAAILGVLVLDGTRWLAVDRYTDRVLLEERTGREVRVLRPSLVGTDWDASPCL